MLEGKVFCMQLAAKSFDHAHQVIRKIDPKSKFKYSKLPDPKFEEIDNNDSQKKDNTENIIDEKKEALV